ncbi:MAG: hypothetical protein AB8F65_15180 [Woeseiaceae bacterium]
MDIKQSRRNDAFVFSRPGLRAIAGFSPMPVIDHRRLQKQSGEAPGQTDQRAQHTACDWDSASHHPA